MAERMTSLGPSEGVWMSGDLGAAERIVGAR
jgi:hypothetical protein